MLLVSALNRCGAFAFGKDSRCSLWQSFRIHLGFLALKRCHQRLLCERSRAGFTILNERCSRNGGFRFALCQLSEPSFGRLEENFKLLTSSGIIPQILYAFQYHASLLSQRLFEHSQLVGHPLALGSMGAGVSNCCNLAVFECLNPLNDIRVSSPLVDETF